MFGFPQKEISSCQAPRSHSSAPISIHPPQDEKEAPAKETVAKVYDIFYRCHLCKKLSTEKYGEDWYTWTCYECSLPDTLTPKPIKRSKSFENLSSIAEGSSGTQVEHAGNPTPVDGIDLF